jgi:uncharacterized protein YegP (UPF0339 family)
MYYEIYKDNAGYYRWRLVANNNKIIADSAESYLTAVGASHGINLVKSSYNAPVYGG